MAATRFIKDTGLTARMSLVMFLLGGLFVALVVGLMYAMPGYALIIGVVGLLLWFLLPVALGLAVVALVFAVLAVVALTRPASWNRAELA